MGGAGGIDDIGGGAPAAVPEADGWAMMLAGLGLTGLALRRGPAARPASPPRRLMPPPASPRAISL
jgi:hypothetical protein